MVSTVFGNSPQPQIVKEPKSLCQSPSGAHGAAFTHSCKRRRSWIDIWRSSTRARMCSQTGRGRLEKRIFGNGVLPEDCPDQVFPRFVLAFGVGLRYEPPISCAEISACRRFRLHSSLRKHDQGPAHRKVLLPRYALDLNCQLCRNGDALTDRGCGSSSLAGCPLHTLMLPSAPAWCAPRWTSGRVVAQRIGWARGSPVC